MTVAEAIGRGRDALRAAGVPGGEAPGDAEVLARHALGWDLTQLALRRGDPAPDGFEAAYRTLISRRSRREPVSQIVGRREFWGLDFDVTRDVLTPRPETELVVQAAIQETPAGRALVIADVGTGSGCLAVTLAREFPRATVIASDVSAAALSVARRNAGRHGVDRRIAFRLCAFVPAHDVDLIVSNPPYVPVRDAAALPPEVREYEPPGALFGGEDGMDVHRQLLREARTALSAEDSARLILEVGYDQAHRVIDIAGREGFELVRTCRDLQGVERVVVLRPPRRD